MKEELCKAFCDDLKFREVPAGFAVSTAFNGLGGEPLGFYVVGPDAAGRFRLEDDGTMMPLIEAAGADLESQTRADALQTMLAEYDADYDEDKGEFTTQPLTKDKVPQAAMKFVALLLRVQDLVLLTPERAASTFKEDATRAITEAIGDRAVIKRDEPAVPGIEFPADLVLTAPNRDPVAIFLALSEQRVLEAVVAQMAALYEAHAACHVIALLEKDTSVSRKVRRQALNRLATMVVFEGDESAAITRIAREVVGTQFTVH